jgi:tripartite-type tricarboxylate transporter receptor subunit TctC
VQSLPDVVPGVEAHGYYAIVVPQGVSRTIIDKIQKDVAGVLSQPEFRQTMLSLGMPPDTSISKNFDGWIDLEVARLRKIIIRAKLQID